MRWLSTILYADFLSSVALIWIRRPSTGADFEDHEDDDERELDPADDGIADAAGLHEQRGRQPGLDGIALLSDPIRQGGWPLCAASRSGIFFFGNNRKTGARSFPQLAERDFAILASFCNAIKTLAEA